MVSTTNPDLLRDWIECTNVRAVVGDVQNIIHKNFESAPRIVAGISNANRHKCVVGVGAIATRAMGCK